MSEAKARELLRDVETLLMVVEPRSRKADYLALLDRVRAYLAAVPAPAEPTMSYANAEDYAKRNPLGGVARVFDIMADRLRAGESLQSVLDDYGYAVAALAAEPVAQPDEMSAKAPTDANRSA